MIQYPVTRYPVILCGDHAEFEREHAADTPPRERPDWPLPSFDARDWAEAFCRKFVTSRTGEPPVLIEDQEGLMIAWFACALMRGYDERAARESRVELCTFGPPTERRRRWILKFEDADVDDMHFEEREEAERAWRRYSDAWTCTLFVTAKIAT